MEQQNELRLTKAEKRIIAELRQLKYGGDAYRHAERRARSDGSDPERKAGGKVTYGLQAVRPGHRKNRRPSEFPERGDSLGRFFLRALSPSNR